MIKAGCNLVSSLSLSSQDILFTYLEMAKSRATKSRNLITGTKSMKVHSSMCSLVKSTSHVVCVCVRACVCVCLFEG